MGGKNGMEEREDGMMEYGESGVCPTTPHSRIPLFQFPLLLPTFPYPCQEGVVTPCH
jgi:hypothetical protein